MIKRINGIIDELIANGANINEEREYLLQKSINIIENNSYEKFIDELNDFVASSVCVESGIRNISVGIKIRNRELIINKGDFKLENTVFDIASITKIFTLKLCYEFEKMRIINYGTQIKEIDPNFSSLETYTIMDVLKMQGFIETEGKLSDTDSYDELIERLYTVKIKDYSKSLYTDIGFILLAHILEKAYEKQYNEFLSFDKLCEKYIFKPYNLLNTGFNLKGVKLLGNDFGNLPSDKKAKILNGVSGAAGIFTNVNDLLKIGDCSYGNSFFDRNFIEEMLSYCFLDGLERRRSYAGIYLHTDNNKKSYAPIYLSNATIAHQGYTGSAIAFDLKYNISQAILVDALNENNKKQDEFFDYFHALQERISLDSLIIYIVDLVKNEV